MCNFWTIEMYGFLTVGYAKVRELIVKYVKVRVFKCKGLELQGKETPIFNLGEVSAGM